jgi:hypothetical protein
MIFYNYNSLISILKKKHLKLLLQNHGSTMNAYDVKNKIIQNNECNGFEVNECNGFEVNECNSSEVNECNSSEVNVFNIYEVNEFNSKTFKSCFLSIQEKVNICNYNNHLFNGNQDSSLFYICKFAYKTGVTINDFTKSLSDPVFINNFRNEIIKFILEKKEVTFVGCDEYMFTINFSNYLLGALVLKLVIEKLQVTALYHPFFLSLFNYPIEYDKALIGAKVDTYKNSIEQQVPIIENKDIICPCTLESPTLTQNTFSLDESNKKLFFELKNSKESNELKKIDAIDTAILRLNMTDTKPHSISCSQDQSKMYPIVPFTKEEITYIISQMVKVFPQISKDQIYQHMILQHKFLGCLSYIDFANIEYELYDRQEKYIDISFLVEDSKNLKVLEELKPYIYEINSDNLLNIKTVRFGISRTSFKDFEWAVNSFLKQYFIILESNKDIVIDIDTKSEK